MWHFLLEPCAPCAPSDVDMLASKYQWITSIESWMYLRANSVSYAYSIRTDGIAHQLPIDLHLKARSWNIISHFIPIRLRTSFDYCFRCTLFDSCFTITSSIFGRHIVSIFKNTEVPHKRPKTCYKLITWAQRATKTQDLQVILADSSTIRQRIDLKMGSNCCLRSWPFSASFLGMHKSGIISKIT